ncbi:MAG: aldo-keto reductase family protein [Fimbriimonadaceae bacterium]
MGHGVFGRTNQVAPAIWYSLAVPSSPPELPRLVAAALATGSVVDVSAHPALFGGFMRGSDALLMGAGGAEIGVTADEDGAANVVHAHLIETLSALGRDWIDFYFLRIRSPLEEFQLSGALKALEWAKDEQHVKFMGVSAETDPAVVLRAWHFHDAFDALLLPSGDSCYSSLKAMAADRRVGVVTRFSDAAPQAQDPVLHTVRSVADVRTLAQQPAAAGL